MRTLLYAVCLFFCLHGQATAQNPWIIGGGTAAQGQFPWVGALLWQGGQLCGTSLIGPKWAITAAHCVSAGAPGQTIDPKDLSIRFNAVDLDGPLPAGGVVAGVKSIVSFPGYDDSHFEDGYDIALLELDAAVTTIVPVVLPAIGDTTALYTAGNPVRVAGWGLQDTVGFASPFTMKWCATAVYDRVLCSSLHNFSFGVPLSSDRFCAGYRGGQTPAGAAAGDSGGPVWMEQGGTKTLLGVVSGGFGFTTRADTPGLYTKVALYRPWIDSVTGNKPVPPPPPQAVPEVRLDAATVRVAAAGEAIRIDFSGTEVRQAQLALLGVDGRLIYGAQLSNPSGQSYTIGTGSLANGIYVLRVFDPVSGAGFTQKLAYVGH